MYSALECHYMSGVVLCLLISTDKQHPNCDYDSHGRGSIIRVSNDKINNCLDGILDREWSQPAVSSVIFALFCLKEANWKMEMWRNDST